MAHAIKEALWIKMFLGKIMKCPISPLIVYCYNQSTIIISKDDKYHACIKHINLPYHFIHDMYVYKLVDIKYCPTESMLADGLTKALKAETTKNMIIGVGLCMA